MNLREKYHFTSSSIIISLFIISSFICSLMIILTDSTKNGYTYLALLPFSFGLFSFILHRTFHYYLKKVSYTIIYSFYFIRMVLIPYFILLSGFEISLGSTSQVVSDAEIASMMTNAIIIMSWEMFSVFLILRFYMLKPLSIFKQNTDLLRDVKQVPSLVFEKIIWFIILFLIASVVFYPSLLHYFELFVSNPEGNGIRYKSELYKMRREVPNLWYWLWVYGIKIAQILVPSYMLLKLYLKYGEKKRKLAVLFSLIIILFSFFLMTPEKATSVQVAIVLSVIACLLYPKYGKKIAPWAVILLGGGAFLGLYIKTKFFGGVYQGDLVYHHFSGVLSAYFSGVPSVATSLCIDQAMFSYKIVIADFMSSIPFLGYFFNDMENSSLLYNKLVLESGTHFIIPMLGQSQFYFGYLLSPLFSFITVFLSITFEHKAEKSQYILKRYVYLFACLIFAQSVVMYNWNIIITSSFTIGVLFLIVHLAYMFPSKRLI